MSHHATGSHSSIYGSVGGALAAQFLKLKKQVVLAARDPNSDKTKAALADTPGLTAVALADAVIHYHIDWVRVNLCYAMNWTLTNSKYWWWTIAVDEQLHFMTYFGLIAVMVL